MENEMDVNLQNQSETVKLVNHDLPIESLKTIKSSTNGILLFALLITSGVAGVFGYKYYQVSKIVEAPEQELIVEKIVPTESPVPSSTFEFVENDFDDSVEVELESSKPNGWISHEFPASNLVIYTPPQWKSSSENFADTSSTLLRFWEAGSQENATIQLNIAPHWDNIGIGNYTIFIVADSIQAYRSDPPKMEEETLDRYQSDFSFERKGKVHSFHCVHNWMEVNIQTCEKMLQTMEFTD